MTDNIHNWKEVLKNEDSPYRNTTWKENISYMSFLIKYTNPGSWLDVGCGLGFFVECCSRFGIDCKGIEGDRYAVDLAKKRYEEIDIAAHDITTQFPFDDNCFSAIFCNQVIEHIPPDKMIFTFSEIYRVLDENGVAFINMPSSYNTNGRKDPSHINLISPSTLVDRLISTGFTSITPTLYPRFILGKNKIGKIIMGAFFMLFPFDFLCSNSSAIAIKSNNSTISVKRRHFYYLTKLLSW